VAFNYLSDADSMADLVDRIKEEDKVAFDTFGHMRIEAVFDNRLFVIYKPQGLDGKVHKAPEIVTTIKVRNYECSSEDGSTVEIEDLRTGERQIITHIPARIFDYDLFMSIPPALRLRWDVRVSGDGKRVRSLSYAVLIKSKNRSDWYSFGVTYAETPNRFRELFPHCDPKINYY
jgi:hypothetical protein